MTRFRFGVSGSKVHRYRFKVYNVDELKCPYCLSDNEVRFVLCCPAFDDFIYRFIQPKCFNNSCECRFALLLAKQNERILNNLALFLYKATTTTTTTKTAIVKNLNVHYEPIIKNVIILIFSTA